jgi:hypothetical protein
MAEAFGVVSGAIGVVGVTLHAVRTTLNLVREIADAPKALNRIQQELYGLELVLAHLEKSVSGDAAENSSMVDVCLGACNSELKRLREMITSVSAVEGGKRFGQRIGQGLRKYLKNDELKEAASTLSSQKLVLLLAMQADLWGLVLFVALLVQDVTLIRMITGSFDRGRKISSIIPSNNRRIAIQISLHFAWYGVQGPLHPAENPRPTI